MLVNTRLGFYFGPSRIGFSLGHVLGLRGNWALEVIIDKKGGIGPNGPRVVCLL